MGEKQALAAPIPQVTRRCPEEGCDRIFTLVTTHPISVFLNGRHLPASPGSSLRQLLAEHEPDLHASLGRGGAAATDARGLPVDPDAPLTAGAIFRVGRSARHAQEDTDA
jgi:hypothetical protein